MHGTLCMFVVSGIHKLKNGRCLNPENLNLKKQYFLIMKYLMKGGTERSPKCLACLS